MTSKENFKECLECKNHSRVPTFLFDLTFGMEVAGYTTTEIFQNGFDGKKSAKSIMASRKYLGHDGVIGSVLAADSRAFGGEVLFPPNGTPVIKTPAFSDPHALYEHDPNEIDNLVLENIVTSYNTIKKEDPEAFLMGHIPSILSLSTSFRGFESFMMDMSLDESYVKDIMNFSSNVSDIVQERIFSDSDPDCMLISAAYDNVDLIGLDGLDKFSMPYISRMVNKASNMGKYATIHPHGSMTSEYGSKSVERFISTGIQCLYYGENNDPEMLSKLIDGRISIMGGIDTYTTIYLGPDSRVVRDTEKILELMKDENYIFTCSCSIDRGLDAGRLKLMMDAVKKN
ncbi:uroporphyrinogen decarboxylase family protein [Candidatus Methanomassiliicoccus intestinalis]|uniref:uroporphyrinogen decarboxylase family protein n=1 Tax=Candidatus Methanomassiliicoccus intestinalis TaxID=1406512 RepID=UPI0037DCF1C6